MAGKKKEIVLTQQQIKDASRAMTRLYSILSNQPTYIGNYMSRPDLENIYKSLCSLQGKMYNPDNYFEKEDSEDEE